MRACWVMLLLPAALSSPALADAGLLFTLAQALHGQRKLRESEPLYQRTLAILESGEREHLMVVAVLSHLGILLQETGRDCEAEACLVRSVAISEAVFGPNHQNLVKPLANLGGLYSRIGRPAAAEPLFTRALVLSMSTFGPDDFVTGEILREYSSVLRRMNRRHEAKDMAKRAKEILARSGRETSPSATIELSDMLPRKNR